MPLALVHSDALLPDLALKSFAMHTGWTLVIAAALVFALRTFPKSLRMAGVALAIALNFLPSEQTPGWWLGLAFQSPSLTLQGICLLYLFRSWRLRNAAPIATLSTTANARWPNTLLILAAMVGWVLLLDLLAAFSKPLYALGFGSDGVLVSLLMAALLEGWSLRCGHPAALQKLRDTAAIIVGAMAIHLLFRLPTGNAWDALIDPWLWLGAQALLLSRAVVWIALFARAGARRITQRASAIFAKSR